MAERLKIARLGHRGDGIADTPGGPVYVPFTLPSEDVSVEDEPGHPDHRRLLKIERTSPGRIEPICPHFGVCGGCALQHWALPRQLEWKHQLVADALAQAGVDASVCSTLDAHGDGRRRVVFHARVAPGGQPAVGFMAARAHQLVAIDICPILAPGLAGALPVARALAGAIPPGKPLDIQMTATENGLDVDLRGSGSLSAKLGGALAAIADRHGLARLTRHGELIAQRQQPMLTIGRAQVALPPAAFLQATVAAEETLARLVLDYVGSARTVADLFSGVGPFALRLAGKAQVSAFDNDRAAIGALTRAAKATSGLKPVNAQARDLFRSPLAAKELDAFAAVVFDPPRQGAQAQARELAASKVPVVVAVSCDAQTFARDAKTLVEGGHRLQTVTPVDQFRYSPHVEIVAKFTR